MDEYHRHGDAKSSVLFFRCLGLFALRSSGGWRRGPARSRGGELLEYLVTYSRAAVARETLCDVLWPDLDADQSAHRLHLAVSGARSSLRSEGPALNPILFVDGSYSWNPRLEIQRDTDVLERCFEDGSSAAFARGVEAYAGQFLAGATAEWVLPLRVRYEHMYMAMLESLASTALEARDFARGANYALELVAVDRTHERASQLAMICLAKTGCRTLALAEFEKVERHLWRSLGVKPMAETERLRDQILGGDLDSLSYQASKS
jgi:DNA-binding SARP family transcriptional activator